MGHYGHGVFVLRRIIIYYHSGEASNQFFHVLDFEFFMEFYIDCFGMSPDNGDPYNRSRYKNRLITKDLPRFIDKLLLLGSISVGLERSAVREAVLIDRMGI